MKNECIQQLQVVAINTLNMIFVASERLFLENNEIVHLTCFDMKFS